MRKTVALLVVLVVLEAALPAFGRIGFECESNTATVKRPKLTVKQKVKNAFGELGPRKLFGSWKYTVPALHKSHPIFTGQTVDPAQGPCWEWQLDEIWQNGQFTGFNSEMVVPPQNGFGTDSADDSSITQFCDYMEIFSRDLDGICQTMIQSAGGATTGPIKTRMTDTAGDPLDVTTNFQASKPNLDCKPQVTISLPPNRLWCLVSKTINMQATAGMYDMHSTNTYAAELGRVNNVAVSGAAKLWLYLVGRFIAVSRAQTSVQNYLKSFAGTILSRNNLGHLYTHALTTADKQTLAAAGLTTLVPILETTTGINNLNDANLRLFAFGWRSNPNPTLTVHAFLRDLLAGNDPIHGNFGDDGESFSKTDYANGDAWIVEFRNPAKMYGDGMDLFRNMMMHMFELARFYEKADISGGCPAAPSHPNMAALSTFATAGTAWAKCRTVASTPFANCKRH